VETVEGSEGWRRGSAVAGRRGGFRVRGGGGRRALEQIGYEGTVVLSQDGELIDETEFPGFFAVDMPAVPGRYTLAAEATYTGTTSDFATASSQSWEFDLDEIPAEQGYEAVYPPVVGLSVEGAEGGWVDDDGPIGITLQAMAGDPFGEANTPIDVESMTFEVSYNDGRTWKRVSIDPDGGTAEAELCPPRRAEFVSVRVTALDTAGTEVSPTTIRSLGLD
jgi:hypothetical protein